MLKVEESGVKQSPFFQKFSGRVSKVPRLGINAVLLREQFEHDWEGRGLRGCDSNLFTKEKATQLFKAYPSTPLDPLSRKLRHQDPDAEPNPEAKLLQRHPSERLPLIHRPELRQEESRQGLRVREKMKSEQNRKESPGSEKYRGWKYPPRLSERALRFFAFAEGETSSGQRSARN